MAYSQRKADEVSAQRPHRGHMPGTDLEVGYKSWPRWEGKEEQWNMAEGNDWNYQKKYNKRGKHHNTTPWIAANSVFLGNLRGLRIWWFTNNMETALGVGESCFYRGTTGIVRLRFLTTSLQGTMLLWLTKRCLFLVEQRVTTRPTAISYISLRSNWLTHLAATETVPSWCAFQQLQIWDTSRKRRKTLEGNQSAFKVLWHF